MNGLEKGVKPSLTRCKGCDHLKYIPWCPTKGCNILNTPPNKLSRCPLALSKGGKERQSQLDIY
jgi:hypothetical protein